MGNCPPFIVLFSWHKKENIIQKSSRRANAKGLSHCLYEKIQRKGTPNFKEMIFRKWLFPSYNWEKSTFLQMILRRCTQIRHRGQTEYGLQESKTSTMINWPRNSVQEFNTFMKGAKFCKACAWYYKQMPTNQTFQQQEQQQSHIHYYKNIHAYSRKK